MSGKHHHQLLSVEGSAGISSGLANAIILMGTRSDKVKVSGRTYANRERGPRVTMEGSPRRSPIFTRSICELPVSDLQEGWVVSAQYST